MRQIRNNSVILETAPKAREHRLAVGPRAATIPLKHARYRKRAGEGKQMKMVALAALAAVSMLGLAQPALAGDRCDRACLEGFADRYVAAMVARDPSRLPWAARARFTENGQELRIGDALWGTASAAGKYRLYVADPEMGQIGFYGTIFENGAPVLLALRLKIENQVISEAETIVARPTRGSPFANAGETLEKKGAPRPQFLRTVPARERLSREDLVKAADSYFTGLAANDGKNTAAFAPTCLRWENGTQTNSNPTLMPARPGSLNFVAMGCEEQQKSGYFAFVTEIRNRRYPVVDVERGIVFSFAFFDHSGRVRDIHLTTGQTVPAGVTAPTAWEISEIFQVDAKGRLDQIEAVLNGVPYGMISDVWDRK
jgi:hypothetical protein